MIKGNVIFAVVVVAVLALSLAMTGQPAGSGDRAKTIKFSHKFHVEEPGIACEECHTKVVTSDRAGERLIPAHENCQSCHEDQITNKCGTCHVNPDNIEPSVPVDRGIRFSHTLHVTQNKVACLTCHAGVEQTGPGGTLSHIPGMPVCTVCHASRNKASYCEACHSDVASILPRDHRQGNFKRDHREITRIAGIDVSCAACHAESFCQDCHTGIELKAFKSQRDLMTEPAPRTPLRDGARESKLRQVHELNYRFTHPADARAKSSDCQICHDNQTFCAACHEAGGNITQKKFKPETHTAAGFTTIGKGTGGGRHAELARRDIESCLACHDTEGSDPVCMLCHREGGAVR